MHRIPAHGADDPRFDGLDDDTRIHVAMFWPRPFDDATLDAVGQVAGAWLRDRGLWETSPNVAWVYETRLTSAGLMFTMAHARDARAPLLALEQRLAEIGVVPRELTLGLVRFDERQRGEVAVAARGTTSPPSARSIDDYWAQCFDLSGPPPDSEMDRECRESNGEHRMGRLDVPGLRISYLTPTPNFLDGDARCEEVGEALRAALAEVFAPLQHPWPRSQAEPTPATVPVPRDRAGEPAQGLERIYRLGRAGYSLSIASDELRVGLLRSDERGDAYRFREHELFTAISAVVAKLGLEPVALWRRFYGRRGVDHHEIQLWETPTSAISQAVRASIDARRAAAIASGERIVLPVHEPMPPRAGFVPSPSLGDGAVELAGPGPLRIGFKPAEHGDELWVVGGGEPRKVDAPVSAYYRALERVTYSVDGAHALFATPCVLRSVALATAEVRELVEGTGYLEVVALAEGLAVLRTELGEHDLDPDDADTVRVWKARGQDVTPGAQASVEPALFVIDARVDADPVFVQMIPCQAGELAAIAGGRVLVVWTPHEPAWRTAILARDGAELGLVATMREALPGLREVDGRAVSTNAIELVNPEARDGFEDLDAIAPS